MRSLLFNVCIEVMLASFNQRKLKKNKNSCKQDDKNTKCADLWSADKRHLDLRKENMTLLESH